RRAAAAARRHRGQPRRALSGRDFRTARGDQGGARRAAGARLRGARYQDPWEARVNIGLTAEQRLIVDTVRAFVETELYPHEDEVERLDEVPRELADSIRRKAVAAGLYAANMPAELGGGGLDATGGGLVEREPRRAAYALPMPVGGASNILPACAR